MKELETLIKALSEATKLLAELKEKDEATESGYTDSTGAVITQPTVILVDKKHGTVIDAVLRDGNFYRNARHGEFIEEYYFALKKYWIAQVWDRVVCYRRDCVFNKYEGCMIDPMLTIGANWKAICGSMIEIKSGDGR